MYLNMTKNKIVIKAIVSADIKKVWDYYTLPEHITKWNFALDTWHCPTASNDLRNGGKYFARMEAKDGSFGFDFEAIYDVIIDYKKIVYTMTDGRQATIDFNSDVNQTEVSVSFDAEQQNSIEMQRDGWQAILNNFKKYTETY
jgi:uncharacterized protein YndB with AHSA1/START domain